MQVTIIKTEVCFSPINVSFDSSPLPQWNFQIQTVKVCLLYVHVF